MKKVLYILVCLGMASVVSAQVTYQLPENNARFIAVERASEENDLVFTVDDSAITEVDVLFGPENDPNLTSKSEYLIKNITSVTPGEYEVTLESEWPEDLQNAKDYYWKVLAYEPNDVGYILHAGPVWRFKTIQIGPYLDPARPSANGVFAGEDAEFSVISSNVQEFQWRYYPAEGEPNMVLSASDPNYIIEYNILTIVNAQLEDEGFYFCVGTEDSSGKTTQSESGELYIKRLKHYFPFNYDDVEGDITPDVIGGVQAQMMGGASVELFSEEEYSEPNSVIGDYLLLENPGIDEEDTEYAEILDTSVFGYPEITISAWFRMVGLDRKAAIWATGTGESSGNFMYFFPYYRQNMSEYGGLDAARYEFDAGGDPNVLEGGYEMHANRWYFVTVTLSDFDSNTGKLYIDGKYLDTNQMNSALDLTKTFAYIGRRVDTGLGNAPLFDGFIDELKIYNYAMSTVEVAQAYLEVMATSVEYICNEEIYDLDGYDYDENCRVDLADFAEIASRWLDDFQIS